MKLTQKLKEYALNFGQRRPIMLAFLGDSVTQGCFELYSTGPESFNTEFRSYEAYHAKLKRMLEELYPHVSINVINAGISGDSAPGGLGRLERDVMPFSPDLAVVCFGLNDSGAGLDGLDTYGNALAGIFTRLQEAGVEVIFMTPNMMCTRACPEEKDPYTYSVLEGISVTQNSGVLDAYVERAKQVCQAHNVPVCDCYRKWKLMEENGVDVTRLLSNRANHPSEKLHWLFAASLLDMILFQ